MDATLITGSSSGIGLEMAKLFAEQGHNLVLVARSRDILENLKNDLSKGRKIHIEVIPLDLTTPEAVSQLCKTLKEMQIEVNVLINNAGFGLSGAFWETDKQKTLEMIQLNVTALTELTQAFLPSMVQKRRGQILNVSSTAAFQPGPYMAVYYATKSYVQSFTEAIATELEATGVTVSALCPGPTHTQFQKVANMELSKLFRKNPSMSAKRVAEIGLEGLKKQKPVVIAGLRNKIMAHSVRFAPRSLIKRIVKNLHQKVRV